MSLLHSASATRTENGKLSLFKKYPVLQDKLPHVSLATLPTPVENLPSIEKQRDLQGLYIKRDDLSGSIYGGNKVRKLEFLLGEALEKEVQEVFTFGFAGSNHALATAIYAEQLGMKCTSLLLPQLNAHYVRRNLLASKYYKARLRHCKNFTHLFWVLVSNLIFGILKNGRTSLMIPQGSSCPVNILSRIHHRLELIMGQINNQKVPMIIPAGGSCPAGVIGYVNAAFELKEQVEAAILPEPDLIYVPVGSMGTSAGLIIGLKAAGLSSRVVPVRVIEKRIAGSRKMLRLAKRTLVQLTNLDPTFPEVNLSIADFAVRDDFLGPGYAHFTTEAVKAAELMREQTGIILNGAYSAKALSALLFDADKKALTGKNILFWNTYNSKDLSSAVNEQDYRQLSKPFHRYFEEEVQPLDITGYDR